MVYLAHMMAKCQQMTVVPQREGGGLLAMGETGQLTDAAFTQLRLMMSFFPLH